MYDTTLRDVLLDPQTSMSATAHPGYVADWEPYIRRTSLVTWQYLPSTGHLLIDVPQDNQFVRSFQWVPNNNKLPGEISLACTYRPASNNGLPAETPINYTIAHAGFLSIPGRITDVKLVPGVGNHRDKAHWSFDLRNIKLEYGGNGNIDYKFSVDCWARQLDANDSNKVYAQTSAVIEFFVKLSRQSIVTITAPNAIDYGPTPAGTNNVRPMPITIQSDGGFYGSYSLTADTPTTGGAQLGDATLRLHRKQLGGDGYADLTGLTAYSVSSTKAGTQILNHELYLDVPKNAKLGLKSTNLRIKLIYY